jgi:GAF domain
MRQRSRASSKLARARSRKAKSLKAVRSRSSSDSSQKTQVVRLTRELNEAREQQAATADVLKVMSRSKFDLQPVLDTLAELAARLCEAEQTVIFLRDGNVYRIAARHGMPAELEEYAKQHPIPPGTNTLTGRVALESRVVHIPDALADLEYRYGAQPLGGYRAMLGVPLLREETCIGVMAITRKTPQPFTVKQIELVQTFADQAVIAIENVRLFDVAQARTNEVQESLEYQTAISEVLNAISRSPSDIQPVLNTIAETAQKLCHSEHVFIFRLEGGRYRLAASKDVSPEAGGTCMVRVEFGKARCRFHGGLSTGPKTEAGRGRIAEAQRRRWRLYREMRQGMSLADAAVVKEQDSD